MNIQRANKIARTSEKSKYAGHNTEQGLNTLRQRKQIKDREGVVLPTVGKLEKEKEVKEEYEDSELDKEDHE